MPLLKQISFHSHELKIALTKLATPSTYVSKFNLLKGYWQVPLTEKAKKVSAFVTSDGLYQYKVLPFGMRNAPTTFGDSSTM